MRIVQSEVLGPFKGQKFDVDKQLNAVALEMYDETENELQSRNRLGEPTYDAVMSQLPFYFISKKGTVRWICCTKESNHSKSGIFP